MSANLDLGRRAFFVVMKDGAPVATFGDGFAARVYAERTGGSVCRTPFMRQGVQATPEVLRELVSYDAESGNIYWRERPRESFDGEFSWRKFNREFAGKRAVFSVNNHGYHVGKILGVTQMAHRVAWAVSYGEWPSGMVDHINGDKRDNRLLNLRDVTIAENNRNRKLTKTNKSGRHGVHWSPSKRCWRAIIGTKDLGRFRTFEEALVVREQAEREHGFHPNHGRRAA